MRVGGLRLNDITDRENGGSGRVSARDEAGRVDFCMPHMHNATRPLARGVRHVSRDIRRGKRDTPLPGRRPASRFSALVAKSGERG